MDRSVVFDFLGSFVFWDLAYIAIIISGAVNKKSTQVGIPIFAVLVNYSLEIAAVVNHSNFIGFSWFVLDSLIVYLILTKQDIKHNKRKCLSYLSFLIVLTIIFYLVFRNGGIPVTVASFLIDMTMAVSFVLQFKHIDPSNRVLIGLLKFLGDACVWIAYADIHFSVTLFSSIAFVCNIIYLIFAVREAKEHPEINREYKENLRSFLEEVRIFFQNMKQSRNKEIVHRKKRKKKKVKKTHR